MGPALGLLLLGAAPPEPPWLREVTINQLEVSAVRARAAAEALASLARESAAEGRPGRLSELEVELEVLERELRSVRGARDGLQLSGR